MARTRKAIIIFIFFNTTLASIEPMEFVTEHPDLVKRVLNINEVIFNVPNLLDLSPFFKSLIFVRLLDEENTCPWLIHHAEHSDVLFASAKPPGCLSKSLLRKFKWLFQDTPETVELLEPLLRLDSHVYLVKGEELSELYSVKGGAPKRNILVDLNDSEEDAEEKDIPHIWVRRSNLSNVVLANGLVNTSLYYYIGYLESNQEEDIRKGYMADTLQALESMLSFKTRWVIPSDNDFGGFDSSGNWTGVVGLLQREEVDMSTAGLSRSHARLTCMDFTTAVLESSFVPYVAKVKANYSSLNAYVSLFHWIVWLSVFVMNVLIVATITLALVASSQLSLYDTLQHFYMLNVSTSREYSVRLIFVTASLFYFLTFEFYSGVLTSFMTFENPVLPFQSYEELAKSDHIKVYIYEKGITQEFLGKSDPGSVFHRLYEKILKQDKMFATAIEVFHSGLQADEVYISQNPNIVLDGNFNPIIIPGMPRDYQAVGFVKQSEFTELFSYHIRRLHAHGFFDKLERKYRQNTMEETGGPEATVVDFNIASIPFGILGFGIIFSILLMIVEKFKAQFNMLS